MRPTGAFRVTSPVVAPAAPCTRMPAASTMSPPSAVPDTPPPRVRTSAFTVSVPCGPPAYSVVRPVPACTPTPPVDSTTSAPFTVASFTLPEALAWVCCTRLRVSASCSSRLISLAAPVSMMSTAATRVSMASSAVPRPALVRTTSSAPVATTSVLPSPASRTPAAVIFRSAVLVVRNLPRVSRPPAFSSMAPLPASTTLRSSIVIAPVPASSVTLPEVELTSPWTPSVSPAAALIVTAPLAVVTPWFRRRWPLLVVLRFNAALPASTSAPSMVSAPALASVTAAPPVSRRFTVSVPVLLRFTRSAVVVTSRLAARVCPVTVSPAMMLSTWAVAVMSAAAPKLTLPVVWMLRVPMVPLSLSMKTSPVLTMLRLPPAMSTSERRSVPVWLTVTLPPPVMSMTRVLTCEVRLRLSLAVRSSWSAVILPPRAMPPVGALSVISPTPTSIASTITRSPPWAPRVMLSPALTASATTDRLPVASRARSPADLLGRMSTKSPVRVVVLLLSRVSLTWVAWALKAVVSLPVRVSVWPETAAVAFGPASISSSSLPSTEAQVALTPAVVPGRTA